MVSLIQKNVAPFVNTCTNSEGAKATPELDHEDRVAHEEEIQIGRPIVDLVPKPLRHQAGHR